MALFNTDPGEVWAYFEDGIGDERVPLPAALADSICNDCRRLIPDTPAGCCWECTWDLTSGSAEEYRQLRIGFEARVRASLTPKAADETGDTAAQAAPPVVEGRLSAIRTGMNVEELHTVLAAKQKRVSVDAQDVGMALDRARKELAASQAIVAALKQRHFPAAHIAIAARLVEPDQAVVVALQHDAAAITARTAAVKETITMAKEHTRLQADGAAGEVYRDGSSSGHGPDHRASAATATEVRAPAEATQARTAAAAPSDQATPTAPVPEPTQDMAEPGLPDVLDVAGAPDNEEIIGSDQVPGQGETPANVMLADWSCWEPGDGKYVVLQTPSPGVKDPSRASMSPDEANRFAGHLDDLAGKAEQGVRPPKPSKYARAARRIDDDVKAGRAKSTDKVSWGQDDDELPLTNKDLLDLLRKADPDGTKDNGTRTSVVCQAAIDAGSDEYAAWAQITPDGHIAVTAIEGVGGTSNPDDEYWQPQSSTHTPASARELAGKVRTFADAAGHTATPPTPASTPDPAPAAPRRTRNSRGETTEYDPATGTSAMIERDGWRAPLPTSSPAAVGVRLLYMREEIKDGRGAAYTDDAARILLQGMTVAELREVAEHLGPPSHSARTKAQLVDDLVKMSVGSAHQGS